MDATPGLRDGAGATVLLVEDNPTTVALYQRVLGEIDGVGGVEVANDGVEALEVLEPDGGEPPVDLVLLDLGLPRKDGHEVLEALRGGMGLEALPVVVVSSSGNPEDVRRAYEAGANGYVQKPAGVEGLEELRDAIAGFWLGAARLPTRVGWARGTREARSGS